MIPCPFDYKSMTRFASKKMALPNPFAEVIYRTLKGKLCEYFFPGKSTFGCLFCG